jgi:hypothetical protein
MATLERTFNILHTALATVSKEWAAPFGIQLVEALRLRFMR